MFSLTLLRVLLFMGDLLSRAPEEIAFFSRTRETSQDNFEIASDELALTSHNGGRSSATPSPAAI